MLLLFYMSHLSYYNPEPRPISHLLKKWQERIYFGVPNFQPEGDTEPLSLRDVSTPACPGISRCACDIHNEIPRFHPHALENMEMSDCSKC